MQDEKEKLLKTLAERITEEQQKKQLEEKKAEGLEDEPLQEAGE